MLSDALPSAAPEKLGLDFRFLDYFSVVYKPVKGKM